MGLTRRPICGRRPAGVLVVLALLVSAWCAPAVAKAAQTDFYVSTTGSDATGTGTSASPWATIGKARDYIRAHRLNADMQSDIVVHVAPGDYYVDRTITFGSADSGTNGHDVVYQSEKRPGTAHLIGGERVTGWSRWSGDIYRTYVGTGRRFYTLDENGKRARSARYPNYVYNPAYPRSQAPYLRAEGVPNSHTVLQYRAGDLDPSGWDIHDAQVFLWPGGSWSWFTDTVPIASIDPSTRQITLAHQTRYAIDQFGQGSRYYIQGILALLDQPGEFYLDTSSGYLYYWPRDGAIDDQTIVAPTVQRLVSVVGGSTTDRAHDIRFRGLTFEMTDFTNWFRHAQVNDGDSGENHLYPEYDRQINLARNRTGMVYLENTDHVAVTNSRLVDSGYSAVYMLFYNQHDTISGNLIEHSGLAGVLMEGQYPGEGDVLKYNRVTNNYIRDVGELTGHGAGVYVMDAGSNEVSYSEISNSPRYAVAVDAYPDIPKPAIYAHDNVLKYLKIHDVAQDSGDTAAVYSFGISDDPPYLTNTYEQITIDGVHADPSMPDYPPNGIFMDNDSYGQTFENVQVTDAQAGPFRNNDSGSHSLTNVSWMPGFDPAQMDYDDIGIRRSFRYAVPPARVEATPSGEGVALSWDRVNNAVSYNVRRATSAGGQYTTTVCSGVHGTSCVDSTAAPGATYHYVVTAVVAGGAESQASTEATVAR